MSVEKLLKFVESHEGKINFIGTVDRDKEWKTCSEFEYPDEFLETEGSREVFDWGFQRVQKILLIKF